MLYGNLIRKHPRYTPEKWLDYDLLYKGGDALLQNRAAMHRIFPMHGAEDASVYEERLKRACYIPYAGAILDFLCASLVAEPAALTAEPKAPAFFDEFQHSVDGRVMSLNDLLKQQVLTALICKCAWTLVDLPPRDDGAVIESEADEEDVGQLRAFAFPVEPECVYDWDESPSGDLEWVLICLKSQHRKSLSDDRSSITERYTWYSRDAWERYEVTYKIGQEPQPMQDIPLAASGPHSFGRVPLSRLEVSDGLWAMSKLAPLARTHLNKRSATDWSMFRHLFPILAAYLGPEIGPGGEIPAEKAQDPARATNQVYGIGRIVQFGDKDRLQYESPDTGIYDAALRDLTDLRDEIHRVVHQMALAANNSAAALGRSGESKAQDKASADVILVALGELARAHAIEVAELAAAGRMDPPMEWTAHGMQDFDGEDLKNAVDEAALIDKLSIPSFTWKRLRTFHNAKKTLRGIANPEQLEEIRAELEKSITEESMQPVQEPDGDELPPQGRKPKPNGQPQQGTVA